MHEFGLVAVAQPDVVLRRHVIEFDADAAGTDAGLDQSIGEDVGRIWENWSADAISEMRDAGRKASRR